MKDLIQALMNQGIITASDVQRLSTLELLMAIIERVNELQGLTQQGLEAVQKLLDKGVRDEVINQLEAWKADGTLMAMLNNEALENICLLMPPATDVVTNTANLQALLDKAKTGQYAITIKIPKGRFQLHPCTIYSNTTIEMTTETILEGVVKAIYDSETDTNKNVNVLFFNAKPFDTVENQITGYNGHSNIKIRGGIIEPYCAMVFCHGRNIGVENVYFRNAKADHYIQIGGCQNVEIKNCIFEGMKQPADNRQYVEMVQIDWLTAGGQPYWQSTAPIFDGQVNDHVEVVGCVFKKGLEPYNYLQTAVGAHSSDGESKNNNIIIRDCRIHDANYAGLTLHRMNHAIAENNLITLTSSGIGIKASLSNQVKASNNSMKYGSRGIYVTDCTDSHFKDNTVERFSSTNEFSLCLESTNVSIESNLFKNCSAKAGINIRNGKANHILNNRFEDCSLETSAIKLYTKDGGKNIRNQVRGNVSEYIEVTGTSVGTIDDRYERLFEGIATVGQTIDLSDSYLKFDSLRIYVYCYGRKREDLFVINNDVFEQRIVNIPNDTSGECAVNVVEALINVIDNTHLQITSVNQVNISTSGVTFETNNNYEVRKIDGIRKQF